MPRRTAADRHRDSEPAVSWPLDDAGLMDALVALQHPLRRRMYESLRMYGPASVGELARRLATAPGSVSHHAKVLHRTGFIEPAPELAQDTRSSCWRALRRVISFNPADLPPGTAAAHVGSLAERANLAHQERETAAWLATRDALPPQWAHGWLIGDTLVMATAEQCAELNELLTTAIDQWHTRCHADRAQRPDEPRKPVRVITRVFPTDLRTRS